MTIRSVAVVGGSVAGLSAVRELRAQGFAGRIDVFDPDPEAPYRRPEVSKSYLSADPAGVSIAIRWPDELRSHRAPGNRAMAFDPARRTLTVRMADGTQQAAGHDALVAASGCTPRMLPGVLASDRVFYLRGSADARRLGAALPTAERVIIVGGGLIGLEVASKARSLGCDVVVVEAAAFPMAGALGADLAEAVLTLHQAAGIVFEVATKVSAVAEDATGVTISVGNGMTIRGDLTVIALGSTPATEWLESSGLDLSAGLACDATCGVTEYAGIVGAGDVASWINPLYGRRMRVEHWANATEQGQYAARRLLGVHDPVGFKSIPYFWSQQGGVRIQVIGSTTCHDAVTLTQIAETSYVAAYFEAGHLVALGAVNCGKAVLTRREELRESLEFRVSQPTHAGGPH